MKHIDSDTLNTYFIESQNVKVFPCSYRGFDESGNIYDPEASGFTEYNFVNIYGKQTKLISWSSGLLKCVIDGYYFEIKNINPTDLYIGNKLYKFAIAPGQIDIVGSYKTKVLDPIDIVNINYLDTLVGGVNCFTGLALIPVNEDRNGAIYFSPCKLVLNEDGTQNVAAIDWQSYRLTDVLGAGDGESSVVMLGTVKAGEDNEDISTVCHAVGENAFAIGNNTTAGGDFSIAGGTESNTNNENSIAIGDHVNTSTANQVVFGAYNKDNTNSALIIGNGISSNKKNILEVSKTGDINATGKLDVDGNISSSNGGIVLEKNGFITVTHNYTESGSDEAKTRNSLLKENGNLEINGDVQFNETLSVEKQTEIDDNIIGHNNLTINGAGSTHILTLGSSNGTSDYGSITVYGKKSVNGQETKTTAFSVDNEGNATIEKTLVVGTKLTVNNEGTCIDNVRVTIANPTTINNTLAVNGAITFTDNTVTTTINETAINYNNGKFTATKDGDVEAKSLTLAGGYDVTTKDSENKDITTTIHYGIDKDGKIVGSELALKDNYKIAANGDATLKDLIINNTTIAGIRLEKGNYSVKDSDNNREIVNTNALKITKYIPNPDKTSTTAFIEQSQGLHVNGKITAVGDFAIGESNGATTKITQGGTAYFKQGLLVGGTITSSNESSDTATLRIAVFSPNNAENTSYADLKGNLNIRKYDERAGNLTVAGDAAISGAITVGEVNSGIKIDYNGEITRVKKIKAEAFDATSDIRKKTAIKDYACKKSILDLPIKEFEFIDDETHTKHIGCIAQDLLEICPEIVHEDADGYLSIEETKLIYLLLQEVKELKKKLKTLKGE